MNFIKILNENEQKYQPIKEDFVEIMYSFKCGMIGFI